MAHGNRPAWRFRGFTAGPHSTPGAHEKERLELLSLFLSFLKNKFIYLFIYVCVGSLLLHAGFL